MAGSVPRDVRGRLVALITHVVAPRARRVDWAVARRGAADPDRSSAEQGRSRLGAGGAGSDGGRPGHRGHGGRRDPAKRASYRAGQVHHAVRDHLHADRGRTSREPGATCSGNFAIGLMFGWVVAANATFVQVITGERMAQVASTMIGSLIVLEGAGAVAFGAVAGAFGVPAAYLLAGSMVTAAGLIAIGYREPICSPSIPAVLDLPRRGQENPAGQLGEGPAAGIRRLGPLASSRALTCVRLHGISSLSRT